MHGFFMLITYPEGDASDACWSNMGVLEPDVLSGTVALAFKTAFIINKIGNEELRSFF